MRSGQETKNNNRSDNTRRRTKKKQSEAPKGLHKEVVTDSPHVHTHFVHGTPPQRVRRQQSVRAPYDTGHRPACRAPDTAARAPHTATCHRHRVDCGRASPAGIPTSTHTGGGGVPLRPPQRLCGPPPPPSARAASPHRRRCRTAAAAARVHPPPRRRAPPAHPHRRPSAQRGCGSSHRLAGAGVPPQWGTPARNAAMRARCCNTSPCSYAMTAGEKPCGHVA